MKTLFILLLLSTGLVAHAQKMAILLNCLGLLIWTYVMRKGIESATAITFYALFTVAGCTYLGNVVFKEPLSFFNGK